MNSKNKDITIYCNYGKFETFIIDVDNIGLQPTTMRNCVNIVRKLAKGQELFFGFYRIDGYNMNADEIKYYNDTIPLYLKEKGRYKEVINEINYKHKNKKINVFQWAASLPINNETFNFLPNLFNFYLETNLFCPKISWDKFIEIYKNYLQHGCSDFILNNYTDFLFTYYDSGDFSVSFNPDKYNKDDIIKIVKETVYEYNEN